MKVFGWCIAIIIGIVIYNNFIKKDDIWSITYIDQSGNARMAHSYTTKETCLEVLHSYSYNEGKCGSNCEYEVAADVFRCNESAD